MPWMFRWLDVTRLPAGVESGLCPDALDGMTAAEVARSPATLGNTVVELGELFQVGRDGSDDRVVVEGDVRHVRGLGRGLRSGTLRIAGDAGPLVGAGMYGGVIEVEGSAGDWAGASMRGGLLRIAGDAGHFLGSALPGEGLGMRDGMILALGSVGDDAGLAMRRGLIAVAGLAGNGLGRGMIAGTALSFGGAGPRAGAGMKRGTIGLFGPDAGLGESGLSPGFSPSGRYRPPFLTIYLRRLAALGFPVPEPAFAAAVRRYNGDRASGGLGEVLVGS